MIGIENPLLGGFFFTYFFLIHHFKFIINFI